MSDDDSSPLAWIVPILLFLVVPGIAGALAVLPRCVGAERWAEAPRLHPLRWEVEKHEAFEHLGRPLLLVDLRARKADGSGLSSPVNRLVVIDRHTGEILGERLAFHDFDPVSIRAGRVWGEEGGQHVALSLPDLEPVAVLEELIVGHDGLDMAHVDRVDFPGSTDTVRLLADDGFLWDLHPDLAHLERLHHDTPVLGTESFGDGDVDCNASDIMVPSGRTAILGTHSRRPALRVAGGPRALEAEEVETPLEGFLDGEFLCVGYGMPIVRPPEEVFVWHSREHDGVPEVRISRVSLTDGLRWTRGETEWAGGTTSDESTLLWVEDQGENLLLWLVRTENYRETGYHFLVEVDPSTGDARWVTAL